MHTYARRTHLQTHCPLSLSMSMSMSSVMIYRSFIISTRGEKFICRSQPKQNPKAISANQQQQCRRQIREPHSLAVVKENQGICRCCISLFLFAYALSLSRPQCCYKYVAAATCCQPIVDELSQQVVYMVNVAPHL